MKWEGPPNCNSEVPLTSPLPSTSPLVNKAIVWLLQQAGHLMVAAFCSVHTSVCWPLHFFACVSTQVSTCFIVAVFAFTHSVKSECSSAVGVRSLVVRSPALNDVSRCPLVVWERGWGEPACYLYNIMPKSLVQEHVGMTSCRCVGLWMCLPVLLTSNRLLKKRSGVVSTKMATDSSFRNLRYLLLLDVAPSRFTFIFEVADSQFVEIFWLLRAEKLFDCGFDLHRDASCKLFTHHLLLPFTNF